MLKRISPTAIGAFIVASLAILVAVIVVVGSGRLFRKSVMFVCMFPGNLNGLKVGAPVKVRGVQIGTVASIELRLKPSEGEVKDSAGSLRLPVILDVDRSQLIGRGATGAALQKAGLAAMIKRGLRAQLDVESLLTGLLYIDLDLHPGTPAELVLVPDSTPYQEIPTVPTALETIQNEATKALAKFQKIDFQALTTSITEAANSMRELAGSPDLKATLGSLKDVTANLNQTLTATRVAIGHADKELPVLLTNLQKNSNQVNLTLKETRDTLNTLQSRLDPDSPLAVRLNQALDQFASALQSVGELANYLQENPSALVRGRYVPGKER